MLPIRRPNEEMDQLGEAITAAAPPGGAPPGGAPSLGRPDAVPTVRGWIQRLLAAGIAYGRGPENAARWEELMQIARQAEAFFRGREER
jgi:hypothetical protein